MQKALEAAQRIQKELEKAAKGGYLRNGWYSYMDCRDIQECVDYILSQAKKPDRE